MRTIDFSPLFRNTVGFETLSRLMDAANGDSVGYPPYNIEKLDENRYRIALAVAGFGEDDIDVTVKDNTLTITGQIKAEDDKDTSYLYRGIASRQFERRFQLADHIEVRDASLANGMLIVALEREVPESMKPRRIQVNSGQAIEGRKAA
ncbi:MAG: Hsp20 family protein [Alphaproteobacteria bacterium]